MEIREKEISNGKHELGKWYYDEDAKVYTFCVKVGDVFALVDKDGFTYAFSNTMEELDASNMYDIEVEAILEVSNPYK